MTISAGVGIANFTFDDARGFWKWVDLCDAGGVDSIWQSDRIIGSDDNLECMSVMAALAGATKNVKFGMNVASLGLRDPVITAKQCATIDVLSEGRLLPAFGIGSARSRDYVATGTPTRQRGKRADMYVEAINNSLRGTPEEKIRFHTCYGINEGPRIHEAPLADIVGHMLKINAGAYSFEAANSRHEHEYHLWETVKLPDGKMLIPGVITHASNIVEHPELIAERLERYAKLVGRENVIAGADCGFSSQACYHTELHPTVIWAKFQAMAEGAKIASERLW